MRWVTIICFSAAMGWTALSFMAYRDWDFAFRSSLVSWLISVVLWIAIWRVFAGLRRPKKAKSHRRGLAIAGVVMAACLSIFIFAVLSGQWQGKRNKSKPSSRGQRLQPSAKENPKSKTAEETAQRTEGLWFVQIAAFRSEEDAAKLATTLKDKGYRAYVVRAEVNAVNLYQTKVGRFRTREEAERFLIVLKDKEAYTTAFVARM